MSNGRNLGRPSTRFTFEVVDEKGKRRGLSIEEQNFSLALGQAAAKLKRSVMEIEHVKTERYEFGTWVTIFDPLAGLV